MSKNSKDEFRNRINNLNLSTPPPQAPGLAKLPSNGTKFWKKFEINELLDAKELNLANTRQFKSIYFLLIGRDCRGISNTEFHNTLSVLIGFENENGQSFRPVSQYKMFPERHFKDDKKDKEAPIVIVNPNLIKKNTKFYLTPPSESLNNIKQEQDQKKNGDCKSLLKSINNEPITISQLGMRAYDSLLAMNFERPPISIPMLLLGMLETAINDNKTRVDLSKGISSWLESIDKIKVMRKHLIIGGAELFLDAPTTPQSKIDMLGGMACHVERIITFDSLNQITRILIEQYCKHKELLAIKNPDLLLSKIKTDITNQSKAIDDYVKKTRSIPLHYIKRPDPNYIFSEGQEDVGKNSNTWIYNQTLPDVTTIASYNAKHAYKLLIDCYGEKLLIELMGEAVPKGFEDDKGYKNFIKNFTQHCIDQELPGFSYLPAIVPMNVEAKYTDIIAYCEKLPGIISQQSRNTLINKSAELKEESQELVFLLEQVQDIKKIISPVQEGLKYLDIINRLISSNATLSGVYVFCDRGKLMIGVPVAQASVDWFRKAGDRNLNSKKNKDIERIQKFIKACVKKITQTYGITVSEYTAELQLRKITAYKHLNTDTNKEIKFKQPFLAIPLTISLEDLFCKIKESINNQSLNDYESSVSLHEEKSAHVGSKEIDVSPFSFDRSFKPFYKSCEHLAKGKFQSNNDNQEETLRNLKNAYNSILAGLSQQPHFAVRPGGWSLDTIRNWALYSLCSSQGDSKSKKYFDPKKLAMLYLPLGSSSSSVNLNIFSLIPLFELFYQLPTDITPEKLFNIIVAEVIPNANTLKAKDGNNQSLMSYIRYGIKKSLQNHMTDKKIDRDFINPIDGFLQQLYGKNYCGEKHTNKLSSFKLPDYSEMRRIPKTTKAFLKQLSQSLIYSIFEPVTNQVYATIHYIYLNVIWHEALKIPGKIPHSGTFLHKTDNNDPCCDIQLKSYYTINENSVIAFFLDSLLQKSGINNQDISEQKKWKPIFYSILHMAKHNPALQDDLCCYQHVDKIITYASDHLEHFDNTMTKGHTNDEEDKKIIVRNDSYDKNFTSKTSDTNCTSPKKKASKPKTIISEESSQTRQYLRLVNSALSACNDQPPTVDHKVLELVPIIKVFLPDLGDLRIKLMEIALMIVDHKSLEKVQAHQLKIKNSLKRINSFTKKIVQLNELAQKCQETQESEQKESSQTQQYFKLVNSAFNAYREPLPLVCHEALKLVPNITILLSNLKSFKEELYEKTLTVFDHKNLEKAQAHQLEIKNSLKRVTDHIGQIVQLNKMAQECQKLKDNEDKATTPNDQQHKLSIFNTTDKPSNESPSSLTPTFRKNLLDELD